MSKLKRKTVVITILAVFALVGLADLVYLFATWDVDGALIVILLAAIIASIIITAVVEEWN